MKPAHAPSAAACCNPHQPLPPLPATVAEIGKIHFEGNIIPHEWYQRITLASGKPDLPAITILAEIIYWYRPYQILDKQGQPLLRKRFDGDMFQCSAAYYEKKFGLTKTQARRAVTRLEEAGLIKRELRDVVVHGVMRNCVMFIEPLPRAIVAITKPAAPLETPPPGHGTPSPVGETPSPVGETPSPVGETPSPVGETPSLKSHHTEITTKTTTEISTETTTTTPNPSSSTEGAAAPEPACSSRGNQDEQPQDQDGNPEAAAQEPTDEQPVSQEEVQTAPTLENCNDTPIETPKPVSQEEGQTAPAIEASSDTPIETPKPVNQEEGQTAPTTEDSSNTPTETPKTVASEEVVNPPQPECNAEVMNPPQPELTDPTAAPAATLAEGAYPDAQNTAQKGLKGVIQGEPHSSPTPTLTEPPAALQADLAGVVRAAETPPTTRPPHGGLATAPPPANAPAAVGPADAEAATDTALVYPAKLTAREYQDIATQVSTLPAEIAQQMLDVIASKLHGSQIRTNAAAVLRGMVRKYRADPASFDPSPGFHITEQRRRRIEAEERSRVEAAQRAQERETLRPAPELAEVRRHAIASMLRTLRGR